MLRNLMIVFAAMIVATPVVSAQEQRAVSFVAFGDSGYIPSYERFEEGDAPFRTPGEYLAAQAEDWLEHYPSMEGFTPTPMVFESALGSYIEASGMYPVAWAMEEVCRARGCNFAAMLGDNIYPDGATLGADGISDARRFDDMLGRPFANLGGGAEDFTIYAMMGNHDWHISRRATEAQLRYLQQHPNFTMPGYFYSAVPRGLEGEVEIFVIDTEMLLASTTVYLDGLAPDGSEVRTGEIEEWPDYVRPRGAERQMVAWLERALSQSTARWRIVMGHHALWSGGGSKFEKAHALRALLLPAVCRYADAYISGDDHVLEAYTDDCRLVEGSPEQPLPLIVSGAASKYRQLHPAFMARQSERYPQLRNLWSRGQVWGFTHFELADESMTVRLYSTPADMSGRPVEEAQFSFPRRRMD